MANTAKYISGDGVGHECEAGSASFEHMERDGSFRRVSSAEYADHIASVTQPGQDGFGVAAEPEEEIHHRVTEGTEESEEISNPESEISEDAEADLSKMTRAELIDEAAKLGIAIDAADKTQTKGVITAAIEAKLAEEPEA